MIEVLLDLCGDLGPEVRYQRLVAAVRSAIPCDSAAILRLEGDELVPLVLDGLVPEAATRRFDPSRHPRLAQIMRASGPVRFTDPRVPDPFDGLIAGWDPRDRVHACMGVPLRIRDEVIGCLAVDALEPRAFDDVPDQRVAMVAALAAATLRTSGLVDQVERDAGRAGDVAIDLLRSREPARARLIGSGPAMRRVRAEIDLCAPTDLAVLLTGETGVGKEVVAHAIHAASRRAARPLVHVNCAALPASVAESELFGHVRGAFTGAIENRAGKLELADGGTLFLDEIGELPLELQPKLLRALQFGELQRVGSDRSVRVDLRVIAATNRDLEADVAAGRFRADLYHRLAVYPLVVPPLRDRREDIAPVVGHFLQEAEGRLGVGDVRISDAARAALEARAWPGNVRELEHVILRAVVRAAGADRRGPVVIEPAHLGAEVPAVRARAPTGATTLLAGGAPLRDAVDEFQRGAIRDALAASSGNWALAARRLGLDRGNLHRLARRLGVSHPA